jgi:hypothetical protein
MGFAAVGAAAGDGPCAFWRPFRPDRRNAGPRSAQAGALFRSVWTSGLPRPVPAGRGAPPRTETQEVIGRTSPPQGSGPQHPNGSVCTTIAQPHCQRVGAKSIKYRSGLYSILLAVSRGGGQRHCKRLMLLAGDRRLAAEDLFGDERLHEATSLA